MHGYCSLYRFFFIVLSLVIPILLSTAVNCHELGTEMEQRFIYSCRGKVTAHKYCPCWGHCAGCRGVLLSPPPNTWCPHLGLDRSLILTQSHQHWWIQRSNGSSTRLECGEAGGRDGGQHHDGREEGQRSNISTNCGILENR